jgi:hypothetical protein
MNSPKEQDVPLKMQLMNKLYLHVGESFAEITTSLLNLKQEAESTEGYPHIAAMIEVLLATLARQYAEMTEVTFRKILMWSANETVQERLPFEGQSADSPLFEYFNDKMDR